MKKILIVDDENKIRELIRLNLELAGYSCIEAADGNEAIEKIVEKPDLVLLDVMLPGKYDEQNDLLYIKSFER